MKLRNLSLLMNTETEILPDPEEIWSE